MNAYEKARLQHFYEAEYGLVPGEHRIQKLFASDELDAIDKMYTLHPNAIIHSINRIGR